MTSTSIGLDMEGSAFGTTALNVCGISAAYPTAGKHSTVLRDVTMNVASGEIVGLVGPNGSGKTSLIRVITKHLRPFSGVVLACGHDIANLPQREVALRVAVVPQDPVLPQDLTAFEVVLMGRTPHLRLLQNEGPEDVDAARRAMLLTDTLELASRRVAQLSGGERQRVVVARALAQETPILLLDEPTTHLDIGHQAAVLELMRSLCRSESKAVLAVVHDLTLASQYCDRLVVLRGDGTIAASGSAVDILTPQLVSRVYGVQPADVDIFAHPRSGRPVVAPRPKGG